MTSGGLDETIQARESLKFPYVVMCEMGLVVEIHLQYVARLR